MLAELGPILLVALGILLLAAAIAWPYTALIVLGVLSAAAGFVWGGWQEVRHDD